MAIKKVFLYVVLYFGRCYQTTTMMKIISLSLLIIIATNIAENVFPYQQSDVYDPLLKMADAIASGMDLEQIVDNIFHPNTQNPSNNLAEIANNYQQIVADHSNIYGLLGRIMAEKQNAFPEADTSDKTTEKCHETFHNVVDSTIHLMEHIAELLDDNGNHSVDTSVVKGVITTYVALLNIADGGANMEIPCNTHIIKVNLQIPPNNNGEHVIPDFEVAQDKHIYFTKQTQIQFVSSNGVGDFNFQNNRDEIIQCVHDHHGQVLSNLLPAGIKVIVIPTSDSTRRRLSGFNRPYNPTVGADSGHTSDSKYGVCYGECFDIIGATSFCPFADTISDSWDENNKGSDIAITGNLNDEIYYDRSLDYIHNWQSIFGKQTCVSGQVCYWKLQVEDVYDHARSSGWRILVGVQEKFDFITDNAFSGSTSTHNIAFIGPKSIIMEHMSSVPSAWIAFPDGAKFEKEGDIIEIILNMKTKELTFIVNGVAGFAGFVRGNAYKLAISVVPGRKIKLVSGSINPTISDLFDTLHKGTLMGYKYFNGDGNSQVWNNATFENSASGYYDWETIYGSEGCRSPQICHWKLKIDKVIDDITLFGVENEWDWKILIGVQENVNQILHDVFTHSSGHSLAFIGSRGEILEGTDHKPFPNNMKFDAVGDVFDICLDMSAGQLTFMVTKNDGSSSMSQLAVRDVEYKLAVSLQHGRYVSLVSSSITSGTSYKDTWDENRYDFKINVVGNQIFHDDKENWNIWYSMFGKSSCKSPQICHWKLKIDEIFAGGIVGGDWKILVGIIENGRIDSVLNAAFTSMPGKHSIAVVGSRGEIREGDVHMDFPYTKKFENKGDIFEIHLNMKTKNLVFTVNDISDDPIQVNDVGYKLAVSLLYGRKVSLVSSSITIPSVDTPFSSQILK